MKQTFLLLAALLFLAGCSEDDTGNNPTPGNRTMTAKVDGAEWTATNIVAVQEDNDQVLVYGDQGSGDGSSRISIALVAVTGPGEFDLTQANSCFYMTRTANDSTFYSSLTVQNPGRVTITHKDDTRVAGTFQFKAKEPASGTTVNVTEGSFECDFE